MPTYVYECSACNTTFEIEQRITENALDTCQCGSKGTVKRIIQPVGISFKGSGFHINDYSGSAKSSDTSSSSETKEESTTPAESSTGEATSPSPASTETSSTSTETKPA